MARVTLSAVVARTAQAVAPPTGTDGELLSRFARTRDDVAFAELVRRLGPMVLGVCRRGTRDAHLAEDAFQAAFVVLSRRAADVRPAEAVRGWLYGVAVRTAQEARTVNARRRTRETPVAEVPERGAEAPEPLDPDALRALDEEVAGLPDHLRAAVALCELDGLSRKDAADRLGIASGTLSSRLAKARRLLAARLKKRGLTVPAVGLAVLVQAIVPRRLAAQASTFASHGTPVPAGVAALAKGAFRTMYFHKLALGLTVGLLLAAASLVATSAFPRATAQDPQKPPAVAGPESKPAQEKKAPAPKPAGPGAIVVCRSDAAPLVLSPEGKKVVDLELPKDTKIGGWTALSPDGKRIALVVNTEIGERPPSRDIDGFKPFPIKVVVRPLGKNEKVETKDIEVTTYFLHVRWTADGKKLIASKGTNVYGTEWEWVVLDPSTGRSEALDLPRNLHVLDCAKDGKTFLVQTIDLKTKKNQLALATVGAKDVTVLCDLRERSHDPTVGKLSPDGKTVAFLDSDPERKDAHKWGVSQKVYLLDLKAKKREELADFPSNGRAGGVAWSPDGKKLAYTWTPIDDDVVKKDMLTGDDVSKETECFLMVADADGKNAKTILTEKGMIALQMVIGRIDWR